MGHDVRCLVFALLSNSDPQLEHHVVCCFECDMVYKQVLCHAHEYIEWTAYCGLVLPQTVFTGSYTLELFSAVASELLVVDVTRGLSLNVHLELDRVKDWYAEHYQPIMLWCLSITLLDTCSICSVSSSGLRMQCGGAPPYLSNEGISVLLCTSRAGILCLSLPG